MDPFTQKLLERTRARKESLQKKMNESNLSPRKRVPLTEGNINCQEREVSLGKKPIQMNDRIIENEVKPDTPAVPSVKSRLRHLSQQRAGWDDCDCPSDSHSKLKDEYVPSPRRTEDKICTSSKPAENAPQPVARKSRLAALAAQINDWEDDTNHPKHQPEPEKTRPQRWQPPKAVASPAKEKIPVAAPRVAAATTARPVNSPVKENKPFSPKNALSPTSSYSPVKGRWQPVQAPASPNAKKSVEAAPASPSAKKSVEAIPKTSVRSFADRMVNGMSRFNDPSNRQPVNKTEDKLCASTKRPISATGSINDVQPLPSKRTRQPSQPSTQQKRQAPTRPAAQAHKSSRVRTFAEQIAQRSQDVIVSPKSVAAKAKSIQEQLAKQQTDGWKKNEINSKIQSEREAEMALLRNRWKVNPELPTPMEPGSDDSSTDERNAADDDVDDDADDGDVESDDSCEEDNEEEEEVIPSPPKKQKQSPKPTSHSQSTWQPSSPKKMPAIHADTESSGQKRQAPHPPAGSTHTDTERGTKRVESSNTGTKSQSHRPHPHSSGYRNYTPAVAKLGMIPKPMAPPRNQTIQKNKAQAIAEYMKRQAAPQPELLTTRVPVEMEKEIIRAVPEPKLPREVLHGKIEEKMKPVDVVQEEYNSDSDSDSEQDEDDVMGELDDLLDEAMAKEEEEDREEEMRKKSQLHMKEIKPIVQQQNTVPENVRKVVTKSNSADSIHPRIENKSTTSLLYSVECYRSQRRTRTKPPAQQVVKRDPPKPCIERQESRVMIHMSNKEQIQTLMEEISAQQSIIHQTSQALNLVAANGDALKGTEQEIEAERLLAIATQRRLACLSEIQRLKHHSAAQSENSRAAKTCKGSLTINDIRLPLKTEYIFTMGSKQDRQIHHFFVLVRNGSHVLASHLLSTHDGLSGDCLPFTNMMTMNDIGSDFLLDIEVYSMQTKKPDVKEKKGNLLKTITPRRGSKKGNMMSPGVSSPGGPGAVRTSSFILVGGTRVALSNVKNTKFNLSKVPFLCPLEGSIHMKVKCYIETKVEERGFLTMFDDVNGFGAWHRRWCVLSNGYVSYWKYPDDERRKAPIGSISLKECSTQNVTTVAREYCARPNTVELVTRRQSRDSDENNLIVTCFGDYTEIKWWMSADTKEERQQWVNKLNKALVNMRQWSRDSTRSQRK